MPIVFENNKGSWKPPPEGCVQYMNKVEGDIEMLKGYDVYCKACYTVSRDMTVLVSRTPGDPRLRIFRWSFNIVDLVEGAESGCHFCGFFIDRFFVNALLISGGKAWTRTKVACCSLASKDAEISEDLKKNIAELRKFSDANPEAHFGFVIEPLPASATDHGFGRVRFCAERAINIDQEAFRKMVVKLDIEMEFFAVKDNLAAKTIARRPFHPIPKSKESLQQVKSWITECINEHNECPAFSDTVLPRRIVKILDMDNLSLCENEDGTKTGAYTTLSYCWGGEQDFATTSSSYDEMMHFKTSDLPATLQDAIFLTRHLGLEYIWIDALCIVQDSPEDKARQLPSMAQYYRNAYITICASEADACTKGFLSNRMECKNHPGSELPFDLLRMPFISSEEELGEMVFHQPWPYSPSQEPIERRAWPLQERALSRRVVSYGAWTTFQCSHHQRTHGGFDDFPSEQRAFNFQSLLSKVNSFGKSGNIEEVADDSYYQTWREVVHAYSVRDFTVESDKLPAIAGLACVFAQATGDEYLAGLWRGQLLRELLWSTKPSLQLLRPKERRAPSWSWASIDNDVTYKHLPPTTARPVATVVSCSVTPVSPMDKFGCNASGTLEIEGPLIEVPSETAKKGLVREYNSHNYNPNRLDFSALWASVENSAKSPRGNEDWEPPEGCAFLILFAVKAETGDKDIASGLLLSKTNDGTYERVADFGSLVCENLDKLVREVTKKVTII